MRYIMRFNGRESGAIGITYRITAEREASTEQEAIDALYNEFEHISDVTVSVCDGPFVPAQSIYSTPA